MTQTLRRALLLLRRNPSIVVPSIVVALLGALAAHALSDSGYLSWGFFADLGAQGPSAFWQFLATIVALGLRVLGALVAIACTIGMADAAWSTGRATLRDGLEALRRDGAQVLAALLLLFLIGLVASALVIPTFGVSLLAYMIFMLYAMAAVVVADRAAPDAIVESVQLAARNLGITFVLVVLIVGLAIAGALLGDLAARIPLLGQAISWVFEQAVVAYATLVVVGEYAKLRTAPNEAS